VSEVRFRRNWGHEFFRAVILISNRVCEPIHGSRQYPMGSRNNGSARAIVKSHHPRHGGAIAEAEHQFGSYGDTARSRPMIRRTILERLMSMHIVDESRGPFRRADSSRERAGPHTGTSDLQSTRPVRHPVEPPASKALSQASDRAFAVCDSGNSEETEVQRRGLPLSPSPRFCKIGNEL